MRIPKNGMLFMIIVIIVMTGIMIIANTNYQYRATLVGWLLDHPDATAVDVNYKTVGGEQTDQLSLVIWVKQKLPEEEVAKNRRLPREIEGYMLLKGRYNLLVPPALAGLPLEIYEEVTASRSRTQTLKLEPSDISQ